MKKLIISLILFMLVLTGCKAASGKENDFGKEGDSNNQTTEVSTSTRKIIFTYNGTIYTHDLNHSIDSLIKLLEGYEDAYIESSEKQSGSATYKVRVKSEDYSKFTGELKNLGDIKNEQQTTDDISKAYFDLEAYLEAKLAEEKRLIELYNQAQTIADMTYISQSIAKVQEEINAAKSTLNSYDLLVSLSTVKITIYENKDGNLDNDKIGFGSKLLKVLTNTGKGILIFLEYSLYVIIYLSPFAVLAIVGWFIYRFFKKRERK